MIDRPQHAVQTLLRRHTSPAERLLVAVSGGADSMGLLGILCEEPGWGLERLAVGHVQHGMRSAHEQEADLEVVRNYAEGRGLTVVVRAVDVPGAAAEAKESLEAAARRLRYQALGEMADEQGCRWVLTGHTLEDSAETVLMRLRSGAPAWEWTGIPPRRGRFLRPVLTVSRTELREWAEGRGVPFRDDPTNSDPRIARNRLRQELAKRPDLWTAERLRQVAEAGAAVGEAMEGLHRLGRVLPERRYSPRGRAGVGLAIDEIFRYFNDLTFIPIEAEWARRAGRPEARLSSRDRQQVRDFLAGSSPLASLPLPGGLRLVRGGGTVWLGRAQLPEVHLRVGAGAWAVPERAGELVICSTAAGNGTPGGARLLISAEVLQRPLWLRSWRAGDRLQVRGRPTKKIAELLAEQGVDPAERPHALVLADEQGPLVLFPNTVAARALPRAGDPEPVTILWHVHDSSTAPHVRNFD